MPEISFQTEPAFKRISAIIKNLIAHNSLYQAGKIRSRADD